MSVTNLLEKAIFHINQATEEDKKGNYEKALKLYVMSFEYLVFANKYEKNPKKKEIITSKLKEYLSRAEEVKKLNKKANEKKALNQSGEKVHVGTTKLNSSLENTILKEIPNVSWDDVAGLHKAKEAIKEAVIIPLKFPHLFKGKRQPWRGILLYGPPGTGKSHLAKAVATESKMTFFSVSSSDLLSRYVGESEKMVKELFEMGRNNKPSIIFIDEIDSLCSMRNDNESEAARRVKTEFLVQMNGVGKDMEGILILAATNTPWMIDAAIRRRFEKRIYIPLPDEDARLKLFEIHVGDTPNSLSKNDFRKLAKRTSGYSGSDIATIVREALMQPIRIIQKATHFKKVKLPDPNNKKLKKEFWQPCSPNESKAVKMSWNDIDGDNIKEPELSMLHFLKALETTKPTVSKEDIELHIKFTEEFGEEG